MRPLAALSGSGGHSSSSGGHSSGGGSYHDFSSEAGRQQDTQDQLHLSQAEQQQEAQQQIEEAEYSLQTLEAAAATNAQPQEREVSAVAPVRVVLPCAPEGVLKGLEYPEFFRS